MPTDLVDPLQMADVAAAAMSGGRGLIAAISAEGAVYRLNVIAASNDGRTRCWDAITAGHLGDIADSDCNTVAVDSGQIIVVAGHDDGSLEILRWEI